MYFNCLCPAAAGFLLGALVMLLRDNALEPATVASPARVRGRAPPMRSLGVYHTFLLGPVRSQRDYSAYLAHGGAAPSPPRLPAQQPDSVRGNGGSSTVASPAAIPSPSSIPHSPSPPAAPAGDEEWLANTAIVTLATGDASARMAVALMQCLRDVGTRVPTLMVLLSRGGVGSADCQSQEWKRANKREMVGCADSNTIAPEIASQQYLDTFDRLGVQYMVIDPIPDTNYTIIPGGRQIFWGMAFNKLVVFGLTQYRKLMWMDADTYVLRNIDHLLKEPMLTGAMVSACCHPNGPAYAGGGIWIVEPSAALYADLLDFISKPVPGTANDPWHWGDMQVVRHYFGKAPAKDAVEPCVHTTLLALGMPAHEAAHTHSRPYAHRARRLWPAINDGFHGYAPGLRYLPKYAKMSQAEFDKLIDDWLDRGKPRKEGFIEEEWAKTGVRILPAFGDAFLQSGQPLRAHVPIIRPIAESAPRVACTGHEVRPMCRTLPVLARA